MCCRSDIGGGSTPSPFLFTMLMDRLTDGSKINGGYGNEVKGQVQAGWSGWRNVLGVMGDSVSKTERKGVQVSGEISSAP